MVYLENQSLSAQTVYFPKQEAIVTEGEEITTETDTEND